MLDKTYSWHSLCWTKPIPGIAYAAQNLIWDLVVKKKMFSEYKNNFQN